MSDLPLIIFFLFFYLNDLKSKFERLLLRETDCYKCNLLSLNLGRKAKIMKSEFEITLGLKICYSNQNHQSRAEMRSLTWAQVGVQRRADYFILFYYSTDIGGKRVVKLPWNHFCIILCRHNF